MKTGAIFPAYGDAVAWTAVTGGWGADYPLANVADLVNISNPARASAPGARTIGGVLSASRTIQAVALIGHNIPAGVAMRVYAFSGTGNDPTADAATLVADSGAIFVWPSGGPVEGYRSIRPLIFTSPVTARSVRIIINDPGSALEIGGIEIGALWEWPGISYGRDLGASDNDIDIELVGGATAVRGSGRARVVSGKIDLLSMATTSTTGLDFQKGLDIRKPFVWAEDYDDPTTWPRKCLFVRNQQLPPIVGRLYRHDSFPIRLKEHMR